MSETGLLLSLVLVAGVTAWILIPLLSRRASHRTDQSMALQRERVQVYYERILRNIHDLDEDYATGKLSREEYQQEREVWVRRGTAALSALDELTDHAFVNTPARDQAALDADIEAEIEARIRAVRAEQTG